MLSIVTDALTSFYVKRTILGLGFTELGTPRTWRGRRLRTRCPLLPVALLRVFIVTRK